MHKKFGPRFRVLHSGVRQCMTNALAEMDLTGQQGQIIGYISHCAQSPCPRDIEETFQLSHPTVSGLLRRLENKGFIQLQPDPQDKRCKRIYLQDKGVCCNQRIEKAIASTEAQLLRDFSPEEQAQFQTFLDRAIANISQEES